MNAMSGARSAAEAREPAGSSAAGAAREPASGVLRRGGGTILDAEDSLASRKEGATIYRELTRTDPNGVNLRRNGYQPEPDHRQRGQHGRLAGRAGLVPAAGPFG